MGTLILFPAIDVKDGRCVRLKHGDFWREVIFAEDPAAQTVKWKTSSGKKPAPLSFT
ncbi:MAG: hypothetical protein LBJ36_07370 [Synergistaceae bacterium]|nr:hypothetical protein [Synergistaceae bacterium]